MPEAAADFWTQLFARAIEEPGATLFRSSDEEELAASERRQAALKSAGWTDAEIEVFETAHSEQLDIADPTSPGVAPWLEGQLRAVAAPIKKAMLSRGYRAQEKVLLGIDPVAGVSASMTNVIMTDEGIVSVSAFLFRWCGLIARAYLRTLHLDPLAWSEGPANAVVDKKRLSDRRDLACYWLRIVLSFASTGTHNKVPYRPSTKRELVHFEQIAWAMEFFVVGHEFAHHALGHRAVGDDPHQQEFQADSLSLSISEMLNVEPWGTLDNPYVRTGAGAHIMLRSLNTLSLFEAAMGKQPPVGDAHPSVPRRIKKIINRHILEPKKYEMDSHWNGTVNRIFDSVDAYILEVVGDVVADVKVRGY